MVECPNIFATVLTPLICSSYCEKISKVQGRTGIKIQRDKLLNREVFDTLLEAQVLVEAWRMEYNQSQATQLARLQTTGAGICVRNSLNTTGTNIGGWTS